LIHVQGLTKQYGEKLALDHVSFDIARGEVLGLLGLNGAGKTTTMNILTGYIGATAGEVVIDGHDAFREPLEVKRVIGYLPETPAFYSDMRVREYLDFVCDLKGVKKAGRREHVAAICEEVGISAIVNRVIRNLSKGYRQRVGFAQALIGSPKVLILDEPTVGLDPSQVIEIRALIRRLGEHSTVIISSHILSEIQAICSRVIVLHEGRLLADDTPDNLRRKVLATHRVAARVLGEPEAVLAALSAIPDLRELRQLPEEKEPGAYEYVIESAAMRDIRADVFRALAQADLPLLYTHGNDESLEDIFLHLIHEQRTKGGEAQ